MKRNTILLISVVLLSVVAACNKERNFDDYKYTTVYFPYQTPVRTLVLGEDIYDNSLDNQHKFSIMATMGGVYENKKEVTIDVAIDNTLAQNLKFNSTTGDTVIAMPGNYYTITGKDMKITIASGKVMGGIEFQLTDAFFNDPRSIKNTFVIPLRMKSVTNADSILSGKSTLTSPDPRRASDWGTVPKNYILYTVKYINPYHGTYLRRGKDQVKGNNGNTALDTTLVYRKTYVEQDELRTIYTRNLTQNTVALTTRNKGNTTDVPFQLALTFGTNGDITVGAPATASYTVNGSGKFVKKGDMWGNAQRDVMQLSYQVNFGTTIHSFTDTLVLRDRAVSFETFTPVIY